MAESCQFCDRPVAPAPESAKKYRPGTYVHVDSMQMMCDAKLAHAEPSADRGSAPGDGVTDTCRHCQLPITYRKKKWWHTGSGYWNCQTKAAPR